MNTAESKGVQPPQTQFPERDFPVVFADGAWSLAHGNGIVKIYFHRFDPSFAGDGSTQSMPCLQMVMPYQGYVLMTMFFRAQLEIMKKGGVINQEEIDSAQKAFSVLTTPGQ